MTDPNENTVEFVWWSNPVIADNHIYVVGKSDGTWGVLAYDIDTSEARWKAELPTSPVLDSWSSLGVDTNNNTVVACVGDSATAFSLTDGTQLWTSQLFGPVVNASPAITTDLGLSDRLFITDYSGFGPGSSLYCINVDPFDAVNNIYQPGDSVWSVPIGQASGSTPAYANGVVYFATADGWIRAFDATSTTQPTPIWETQPAGNQGFFGGVAIFGNAGQQSLFAATFNTNGSMYSSTLVKLDAQTGQTKWAIPANRTSTTPLPMPNGQILLSAGIRGFGTVPSVALFDDLGTSATRVWDTAINTWNDSNNNTIIDPGEYFDVGGWSCQPLVLCDQALTPTTAYIGVLPAGAAGFGAYQSLIQLDITLSPVSPNFNVSTSLSAGASPSIVEYNGASVIASIGAEGISVFRKTCFADCDNSSTLNILDFICFGDLFAAGNIQADCDNNSSLNILDYICFGDYFATGCS